MPNLSHASQSRRLTVGMGVHELTGNTVVAGTPDVPVSRQVHLLASTREPLLLSKQWSNQAGDYAFDGIAQRQASEGYTVIAYDHTGVHDPAAKANLVPTPMPPDPAEHA